MRFLIVANQTLLSERMEHAVSGRASDGQARFHIVVPATAPQDQVEPPSGDAVGVAEQRLAQAVERWAALGVTDVTGEVGTEEPLKAIEHALERERYDGIIVATLPLGVSRWLRMDLPNRLRRKHPDVLVDHLEVEADTPA